MKICIILNDPPYGTERCFNGLRLALALLKTEPKPELSVKDFKHFTSLFNLRWC